jgi:hypothetical protein
MAQRNSAPSEKRTLQAAPSVINRDVGHSTSFECPRSEEDFMTAHRFSSPALAFSLGLVAFGCSTPDSTGAQSSADELAATPAAPSAPRECVIDTITVTPGLLKDLRASVGDAYYKEYPGAYPHIEIPGALDAALPTTPEFGEWFYTVVGFSYDPPVVPNGAPTVPGKPATLSAGPVDDPLLVTAKKNYAAALAIFGALTKAQETTTSHTAQSGKDTSWVMTTRTSPAQRIICSSTTYPDSGEKRPQIDCTFFGVERNAVQIYSTATGAKCLAER